MSRWGVIPSFRRRTGVVIYDVQHDLRILMVDDDPNDQFLVQTALEHSGVDGLVRTVKDGEEAIEYLCGRGRYSDRLKYPLPNVIFTDLKMPGMNGFELLEWMRANPRNAVIPTVVFSSSRLEKDVVKAYQLGASSFFVKPHNLKELVRLVRTTSEYWSLCETPPVLTHCE